TRASGEAGDTVRGSEHDLDALMQKAAEAVYARTQQFRYAIYLIRGSQSDRAASFTILQKLALRGSARDRIWAYMGLGTREEFSDPLHAAKTQALAIPLAPRFALPYQNISNEEYATGHDEAALTAARKGVALLEKGDGEMSARASAISLPAGQALAVGIVGDFVEANRKAAQCDLQPDYSSIAEICRSETARNEALQHDLRAARGDWSSVPVPSDRIAAIDYRPFEVSVLYDMNEWDSVIQKTDAFEKFLQPLADIPPFTKAFAPYTLSRRIWPYTAAAMAHTGDMKGALALIGKTPLDCDLCVRMRGNIAAMNQDWAGAAQWFAMVSARSPSVPFADSDWGAMLLQKGDYDAAIAKFETANQKSPHFADPLEMWGEALIAKNRSDLALAKFEEAEKYAPNWGRLHLKWGEALLYVGNKTEAQKQFARASRLYLTPAETAQLAKASHG
ncbi:MAG TPA: tetratricopeptide repeat protein, partial [Rhizomicrobium sp.]